MNKIQLQTDAHELKIFFDKKVIFKAYLYNLLYMFFYNSYLK